VPPKNGATASSKTNPIPCDPATTPSTAVRRLAMPPQKSADPYTIAHRTDKTIATV
jgi:hypothetical protein